MNNNTYYNAFLTFYLVWKLTREQIKYKKELKGSYTIKKARGCVQILTLQSIIYLSLLF